jgi:hypothetical protein
VLPLLPDLRQTAIVGNCGWDMFARLRSARWCALDSACASPSSPIERSWFAPGIVDGGGSMDGDGSRSSSSSSRSSGRDGKQKQQQ